MGNIFMQNLSLTFPCRRLFCFVVLNLICQFLSHFLPLYIQEDPTTRRWLQQLLHNVGVSRVPALQAGGGFEHMMVN